MLQPGSASSVESILNQAKPHNRAAAEPARTHTHTRTGDGSIAVGRFTLSQPMQYYTQSSPHSPQNLLASITVAVAHFVRLSIHELSYRRL